MAKRKRANLERLLVSAWEKQQRWQTEPIMVPRPPKPPWHESALFWGCFSLAAAIVLAVIAAMQKDLRWLLLIAWPFAGISSWVVCRKLKVQAWRWTLFLLLLVGTGVGLVWLHNKLVPIQETVGNTPVTPVASGPAPSPAPSSSPAPVGGTKGAKAKTVAPRVVKIEAQNLLAFAGPSEQCRGYELLLVPEMDPKMKIIPLDSVHLTVRFPQIVKDFRVFIGTNYASVIKGPSGCHFDGPPSETETVNSKTSFNIYENKFTFDAHSLDETLLAEFLTDETTPDVLARLSQSNAIVTKFPELIEYDGFCRYNGSTSNSIIDFQLKGIETFIVFKIKDSSPENFSMVGDNFTLGGMMEVSAPLTEEQLRKELISRGKGEDEIEAIIQEARTHQEGHTLGWVDSLAHRDGIHPPRLIDRYRLNTKKQ